MIVKKKYELTTNTRIAFGKKLFQIKALISFGFVKAGDLGGYVESEDNLSHDGDAWVYDDAWVSGNARVCGDALVQSITDYICFKGFGSYNRNTSMFKTKSNAVFVNCGCFSGTLKKFEERVKEKHGYSKYAKEYLACIEAAKIHFEIEE